MGERERGRETDERDKEREKKRERERERGEREREFILKSDSDTHTHIHEAKFWMLSLHVDHYSHYYFLKHKIITLSHIETDNSSQVEKERHREANRQRRAQRGGVIERVKGRKRDNKNKTISRTLAFYSLHCCLL